MGETSKKNISILLILVISILFTISIYFAFIKYNSYQNLEKTLDSRSFFTKSNKLLKALEEERLQSILYLTKANQESLNKLNQIRKKVNAVIGPNKKLLLTKELKQLVDVRKKINTLSIDYQSVIYDIFHIKILNSIILKMRGLELLKERQSELQLIKLRENINMENSFLAIILTKKIPMKKDDILFWEKILDLRQFPIFDSIRDQKLLLNIQNNYKANNFSKFSEEERVKLFITAKNAQYPISFSKWMEVSSKQKDKISLLQKQLAKHHKEKLQTLFLTHQSEMYKSIIISLLILILLGLLLGILHILKKMNKDERILKNTVKEIEVDLDDNKKREIKEILTHNSSVEVYEFLANAIKEPSRAKDLFLANMSHEIRTPLNGIIGFTKELKETKLSEEQDEIVNIIEESSDNLMHIVNDILDFSKLKAGKVQLEHILFDPIEKFEASIDTFVAKAREKEIELKVCIDPHIPTSVLGDPTKLVQILSNLLSNAIKFTPEHGNIEIDIQQDASVTDNIDNNIQLEFSVKDSGIGISTEEQKEIYNAFSQADVSTSRKYGGTGLGLSIASQFIQHMGGTLEIESQVGKGTRFFFSILLDTAKVLHTRPKENLSMYTIGYIPPIGNRSIDKNLKTYVEYQGATFRTYTQRILLNLREAELPDLLFIDYKCFDTEGDIEYFLDLPLKIVLIVADNREKELVKIKEKIDKILHKPVNLTRTLKSLEILKKAENNLLKKPSKKVKNKTKQFNNIDVLVAEDNAINQKLMKNILNRFGMNVTIVSNGEEAFNARKNNQYKIIFMDIQMPIMGGVEATKHILDFEETSKKKHIPIVALTANALEGDREKYMKIGMDAYLPKPMDLDELKSVLHSFIS